MAGQFRIKRTLMTIPVTAGQSQTVDLPRNYDIESIHMRIVGTVNVTTLATSVRAEAPCQAVARAEVIADGRNTLYSAPFWFSCLGKYDRPNMLEAGARPTTPPSGVAVAAYAVEANGVIDFLTPDGERPKDSNFRSSGLQLFQLRLTFGNPGDLFVGGVANFGAGFVVEVSTIELVELPSADGSVTVPASLKKVSFQEVATISSNVSQEIRLPAGNLIKSVVARFEGGVTAGEPSTNNLNRVTLGSGVDIRLNMTSGALRGTNNNDYGQLTGGYYIMDMARNGSPSARLSELWDVTNTAEPKLTMDVTGFATGKMQAIITEYLALRV